MVKADSGSLACDVYRGIGVRTWARAPARSVVWRETLLRPAARALPLAPPAAAPTYHSTQTARVQPIGSMDSAPTNAQGPTHGPARRRQGDRETEESRVTDGTRESQSGHETREASLRDCVL
jgi:hypothetical protein